MVLPEVAYIENDSYLAISTNLSRYHGHGHSFRPSISSNRMEIGLEKSKFLQVCLREWSTACLGKLLVSVKLKDHMLSPSHGTISSLYGFDRQLRSCKFRGDDLFGVSHFERNYESRLCLIVCISRLSRSSLSCALSNTLGPEDFHIDRTEPQSEVMCWR